MFNLQGFIKEKKINKVELSRIIGISRATLDTWIEDGKTEHMFKIIRGINLLAKSLVIPIDDTIEKVINNNINSSNDGDAMNLGNVNNYGKIKVKESGTEYKSVLQYQEQRMFELMNEVTVLKEENAALKKMLLDTRKE